MELLWGTLQNIYSDFRGKSLKFWMLRQMERRGSQY